jgi:uncharacterized protein
VTYEEEVEAWRRSRLARLTAPEGWLSQVGLFWLREGENSLGSDPSTDVVLPGEVPPRVGSIDVTGGRATARFLPGSGATHNGEEVTELALEDDVGRRPTELALGRLRLHVINRGGTLALRVRDLDAPTRRSLEAIPHSPVDPRWRVEARFTPYDPPRRMLLPTVIGPGQDYRIMGRLSFEIDRQSLSLEAYQELDETDLFIVFGDLTNRTETYGGGRYLYASPPDDGRVVLDFNRAYNPPCVFTPYATCVLAQPENRLPVRIEAGELRFPS